jgi:hypothetical protein
MRPPRPFRDMAINVLSLMLCLVVVVATAHKSYASAKLPWALYAGLLLLPTAFLVWQLARTPFSGLRWFAALLACSSMLLSPWLGRDRRVAHSMRWELVPRGDEPFASNVQHLRFRFVERPTEYVGIYSDDLLPYLRSVPTSVVEVEFKVTYDLWIVRGFEIVRVGERTDFNDTWGNVGFETPPGEKPRSRMTFP